MAETDLRSAEARMIAEARKAFFTVFGLLAVVWAVQLGNWSDSMALTAQYGVRPHDLGRLPEIFTAPLLHFSWGHLQANSGPLFIFGFLAAYRGVAKFLALTALVTLTSGLTVWIFQSAATLTVGASGLVFGYFGYVVLRGVFDRHLIDTLIGLVMAASFAYLVFGAMPGAAGQVSWLGHLGGLVGGLAGAWLLRDRTRPAAGGGEGGSGATGGGGGRGKDKGDAVSTPRSELLKELDDLGL
ncbi:rhomboid family intramembrane serine protease [Kitasatospora azatica]|uniref:rhomboid family intramembrane serine protease n=1 Tax=Kitasatospora azatica TaxID=58347 RepID=UPI0005644919|nr:rhomboid family intramembrane serine protease [Kitasatospora azatica]